MSVDHPPLRFTERPQLLFETTVWDPKSHEGRTMKAIPLIPERSPMPMLWQDDGDQA